jgi:translation initiation factor IF-2
MRRYAIGRPGHRHGHVGSPAGARRRAVQAHRSPGGRRARRGRPRPAGRRRGGGRQDHAGAALLRGARPVSADSLGRLRPAVHPEPARPAAGGRRGVRRRAPGGGRARRHAVPGGGGARPGAERAGPDGLCARGRALGRRGDPGRPAAARPQGGDGAGPGRGHLPRRRAGPRAPAADPAGRAGDRPHRRADAARPAHAGCGGAARRAVRRRRRGAVPQDRRQPVLRGRGARRRSGGDPGHGQGRGARPRRPARP